MGPNQVVNRMGYEITDKDRGLHDRLGDDKRKAPKLPPSLNPNNLNPDPERIKGENLELAQIGTIFFRTNSATLGDQEKAALSTLKEHFRGKIPKHHRPMFYFVGHADYRGPERRNKGLAMRRARESAFFFRIGMGSEPGSNHPNARTLRYSYVVTDSRGESVSVQPPLEGRSISQDRRVDIYIDPKALTLDVPEKKGKPLEEVKRITYRYFFDINASNNARPKSPGDEVFGDLLKDFFGWLAGPSEVLQKRKFAMVPTNHKINRVTITKRYSYNLSGMATVQSTIISIEYEWGPPKGYIAVVRKFSNFFLGKEVSRKHTSKTVLRQAVMKNPRLLIPPNAD